MLAWVNGEKVQLLLNDNEWVDYECPAFDWEHCRYRIKPKVTYLPYESAKEVMEAIAEHGDWVRQGSDIYRRIDKVTTIGNRVVISLSGMKDWGINELPNIEKMTFIDGTPFGKLEEL